MTKSVAVRDTEADPEQSWSDAPTVAVLGVDAAGGGSAFVLAGVADPSTGDGRGAGVGSIYLRRTPGQVWVKTGAANTDWTLLTTGSPAQGVYLATGDPGAVGAGSLWIDTSGSEAVFRVRTNDDTTWNAGLRPAGGIEFVDSGSGVTSASYYRFVPFGGGFTIEEDGSKINVDTPFDMSGTGILNSGDIDMDGDDLQNVGTFSMSSPPEIPATPAVQDVVDALVTLGLVTQAA